MAAGGPPPGAAEAFPHFFHFSCVKWRKTWVRVWGLGFRNFLLETGTRKRPLFLRLAL